MCTRQLKEIYPNILINKQPSIIHTNTLAFNIKIYTYRLNKNYLHERMSKLRINASFLKR